MAGVSFIAMHAGRHVLRLFLTPMFYVLMRELKKRITGTQEVHYHPA